MKYYAYVLSVLITLFFIYSYHDVKKNTKVITATYTGGITRSSQKEEKFIKIGEHEINHRYTDYVPVLDYKFLLNRYTYIGHHEGAGGKDKQFSDFYIEHKTGKQLVVYYDQRDPHKNYVNENNLYAVPIIGGIFSVTAIFISFFISI